MKAMILAAGLGTRLRPYTLKRPKPLFPILDRPLLELLVSRLQRDGFSPIIINAHHLAEQIITHFEARPEIILQHERIELGTGGGLKMAARHFGADPVLITNGDIYHNIDYRYIYEEHCRSGAQVTMVLHDCPRFNNVHTANGWVTGFSGPDDEPREMGNDAAMLAFTGIHVIDPKILTRIESNGFYSIIDCYRGLIADGVCPRVHQVEDCFWTDIGTPADYLQLHEDILLGKVPDALLAEHVGISPFFQGSGIKKGRNTVMRDWACIGSNVTLGDNVHLRKVVIWDGAQVADGAVLEEKIIV